MHLEKKWFKGSSHFSFIKKAHSASQAQTEYTRERVHLQTKIVALPGCTSAQTAGCELLF